ncbi:hypothetical protein FM076_00060 [Streptomyces albus subsp. chlorinus]|uniref:hypothetical protein n=1 Tax=Streptomyces albus TaxID=1888 RepID=UPI00156DC14E|nr:hypothetical protein [Streptomyces albus]NSC19713.1 hypothetical protein [Streptomyces albus subsp. chlorinus]
MRKKIAGVLTAASLLCGLAAASQPAQAAPSTQSGRDGGCTMLWASAGVGAEMCKSYWPVGNGYTDGWVAVTKPHPKLRGQVMLDGNIVNYVSATGQRGSRDFSYQKRVLVRVCYGNTDICSNWW